MIENVCYKHDRKNLKKFFDDKYMALLFMLFAEHGNKYLMSFRNRKQQMNNEKEKMVTQFLEQLLEMAKDSIQNL